MQTPHARSIPGEASLVRGGPAYRLACRLGLSDTIRSHQFLKVLILILVTWVPLVLLALFRGEAWGRDRVRVPLLEDPVVYSRFLFVIPLLELARAVVERGFAVMTRQFLRAGLVPDHAQFASAHAAAVQWRGSNLGEGIVLLLACSLPLIMQVALGIGPKETNWSREGQAITPAGWWYVLISLPILYFFLLRWLLIYLVWTVFLVRVARLNLELTPTHPDQAGGLGFLGWGLTCFAPVVMAISAVIAGGFAYEILHRNSSLDRLKYHVIVFLVLTLLTLQAPLLAFVNQLKKCRGRGLLDFGTLAGIHDRAFENRWIHTPGTDPTGLLGNQDATSLVMLAQAYDHIKDMQVIPFDKKALMVLLVAALLPMLPLVWTAIPMTEILAKLAHLMV